MTANLPVPYEQYNAPKRGGTNKIAVIVAILVTAVVVGLAMFFWGPVAPTELTSASTTTPTATVTESVTATVTVSPSANIVIAPTPEPTPTATTALPTETAPTDMPIGQSEYLADLDIDRGDDYGVDPLAINGQIFVKSVGLGVWNIGDASFAEYTLDGKAKRLEATIGLNDALSPDAVVEFTISGNGRQLLRKRMKYASQEKISVPIEGNVKLRITTVRVGGENANGNSRGAVLGDALLIR
ncbi:NPCBM/NEW2 domain-containing protein [Acrocarpospora pleiomorpha]|uniref:NPCBM/NEW2 domain-containing protein n=1 Tax=Acrocarpospora pleiomorpha TaxID=90975 RepID=UPI0012D353BB|nr:NPCBM/NEW2 domain-containing protein [Acrocarpospora pleiomorpha]